MMVRRLASIAMVFPAAAIIAAVMTSCSGTPVPTLPLHSSNGLAQKAQSRPAQRVRKGHLGAVLTSGDGTQIFGFDVGQNDASGILSTATHIETFDQQTGVITSSFPKVVPPRTTYAMDGIFPGALALVTKYVMPKGSIYAKRFYGVISPFTAGKFTGTWTPPVKDVDVQQGSKDLTGSTSALFAIELENNDRPDL